jgi:hypothetical protein
MMTQDSRGANSLTALDLYDVSLALAGAIGALRSRVDECSDCHGTGRGLKQINWILPDSHCETCTPLRLILRHCERQIGKLDALRYRRKQTDALQSQTRTIFADLVEAARAYNDAHRDGGISGADLWKWAHDLTESALARVNSDRAALRLELEAWCYQNALAVPHAPEDLFKTSALSRRQTQWLLTFLRLWDDAPVASDTPDPPTTSPADPDVTPC